MRSAPPMKLRSLMILAVSSSLAAALPASAQILSDSGYVVPTVILEDGEASVTEMEVPLTPPPATEDPRGVIARNPCDLPARPGALASDTALLPWILTGGATLEEEVHDCQRLVVVEGEQASFGPLAGLYPLDAAMASDDRLDFIGGRPVASVYNWGDFQFDPLAYDPLQLTGWQCLWLRWNQLDGWEGALTTTTQPCSDLNSGSVPESAWVLDVHESLSVIPIADYPRTVRWRWSTADSVHYFGSKCGDAWCSIGPGSFTPGEGSWLVGHPVHTIPGYYDEQHLAIETGDAARPVRPGPWGRIRPGIAWQRWTDPRFVSSARERGVPSPLGRSSVAAQISVRVSEFHELASAYTGKFGLTPLGDSLAADIRMRASGGSYRAAFHRPGPFGPQTRPADVQYRRVMHGAPGSTRWQWQEDDEKTWIACPGGCCSVQ